MEYNGAEIVVSCFLELNCAKDSRILDVGAGTGIIGSLLKNYGYDNIDGLDASQKMLDLAKEKNCYKNLINTIVSPNTKLPIENKTYDVIIMAGVLCPGHISIDAFNEILRITKSGIIESIIFG
jgi:ubiquinone/menaquinone biosynthesis C-methylase UbiE